MKMWGPDSLVRIWTSIVHRPKSSGPHSYDYVQDFILTLHVIIPHNKDYKFHIRDFSSKD